MRQIISEADFIGKTNNTLGKARGKHIEEIDRALQFYEGLGVDGGLNVQAHLAGLQFIVSKCLHWLKLKEGKKTKRLGLETLFGRRKKAISALANDALANVFELLVENGLYNRDEFGRYHFERNKLQTLGSVEHGGSKDRAKKLTGLSNGYQHERTTYLQSKEGKQASPNYGTSNYKKAISANTIHTFHKELQNVQELKIPNRVQAANSSDRVQNQYLANYQKVLSKNVDNLSPDDFRFLDEIGRLNQSRTRNFDFIAKTNRFRFMAIPEEGKFVDYEDNLITTTLRGAAGFFMYAMDKYGNIILKQEGGIEQGVGIYENAFNHSSFNAGADVICAGMIKIANGVLIEINNSSGHYKPSRDALHRCVTTLRQDAIRLTETRVTVLEYKVIGGTPRQIWTTYDASEFLRNPHSKIHLEQNEMAA